MQDYIKERQGDPTTKPPPPNPLMMGMDAGGYVLKAVGSVKVTGRLVYICLYIRIYIWFPNAVLQGRVIGRSSCAYKF